MVTCLSHLLMHKYQFPKKTVLLDLDILNDVTLSGVVKGTPGFLAPEQIGNDNEKKQSSDIYALGAILYYILTKKPPVTANNLEELIGKTKQGIILSPELMASKEVIPRSLSAVCMKALSLKSEDRYQSVEQLQKEIEKGKRELQKQIKKEQKVIEKEKRALQKEIKKEQPTRTNERCC